MTPSLLRYLAMILCAVLVTACGKKETGAPAEGAPGKKLKLAFVTNNASDFWTIARAGCNKAGEELPDVKIEFKIPGDGSAATQRRILDDLLAKGIDGIAISPIDPANQTPFLNEVAKQ